MTVMAYPIIMPCVNICDYVIFAFKTYALLVVSGQRADGSALPGDNPIYDVGDTAISLRGVPWTTLPVHPSLERTDSAANREFDNPIYGRNETENVYSNIDSHQTGIGMGPQPYHNYHNPIYSEGTGENVYSVPSNSSSLSTSGTATDVDAERTMYENTNSYRETGREQLYDQII